MCAPRYANLKCYKKYRYEMPSMQVVGACFSVDHFSASMENIILNRDDSKKT